LLDEIHPDKVDGITRAADNRENEQELNELRDSQSQQIEPAF